MNDEQQRRDNARALGRWRDMVLSPRGPSDHQSRLVAVGIAKFVNVKTRSTFVGVGKLSEATGLGDRTVRDRLHRLESEGFVSLRPLGSGRDWKLREITPRWPACGAGLEVPRPASRAGHDGSSRPAPAAPMTGTPRTQDRHGVPINSCLNPVLNSCPSQPFPPSGKGRSADAGNGSGAKTPREAGTNPRAEGRNPRATGANTRALQNRSMIAWTALTLATDAVKGMPGASWADAEKRVDANTQKAVAQLGGYKLIADRTRFTSADLKRRFRMLYEAEIISSSASGGGRE